MDDESKKQFGGRLTDSEDFPDDFDREENDLNHYKAMSVINDLPIEIQTAICGLGWEFKLSWRLPWRCREGLDPVAADVAGGHLGGDDVRQRLHKVQQARQRDAVAAVLVRSHLRHRRRWFIRCLGLRRLPGFRGGRRGGGSRFRLKNHQDSGLQRLQWLFFSRSVRARARGEPWRRGGCLGDCLPRSHRPARRG